jgi:hypothetical protein
MQIARQKINWIVLRVALLLLLNENCVIEKCVCWVAGRNYRPKTVVKK